MSVIKISLLSVACLALLASGCDTTKTAHAKPKPKPSATAAATPTPAATQAAPKPTATAPARPTHLDTKLTAARRAKIEKAHPDAKGFLVMKDLQDKLKKEHLKAKGPAMKAFDRLAKGKWVLFTGPLTNESDTGFSLGVVYTPRAKGDIMGMSRQYFLVKLTKVKGFAEKTMKNGTMVAVLAKYEGKGKAGPGFELVSEGNW